VERAEARRLRKRGGPGPALSEREARATHAARDRSLREARGERPRAETPTPRHGRQRSTTRRRKYRRLAEPEAPVRLGVRGERCSRLRCASPQAAPNGSAFSCGRGPAATPRRTWEALRLPWSDWPGRAAVSCSALLGGALLAEIGEPPGRPDNRGNLNGLTTTAVDDPKGPKNELPGFRIAALGNHPP
jgi:hypothetical protein